MHVGDKDLELYVLGQLSPSQISIVEAHLCDCQSCGSKLNLTLEVVQQMAALSNAQLQGPAKGERRRSGRTPTDDPARMKVFSPISLERTDVRVLDVSEHGLKLRVPEFLHPGTLVQIRLKDSVALAEVRYCLATPSGFHAGVMIEDVFENPGKTSGP